MTREGEIAPRALVIGGAHGFIGRGVSRGLLRHGLAVHTLDRGGASTNDQSTGAIRAPAGFDWQDPATLLPSLQVIRPHHVVHAIGSASVGVSMDDPTHDFLANVETFRVVLEAARLYARPTRVILVSSAAVYGNPTDLPVCETHEPNPISTYGYNKILAETLARCYADLYAVHTTVLRVFSVVGPEQHRLLPFELWSQATKSPTVSLQGSGRESRDFLHIDDLADAVALLMERPQQPDFEILNLASGAEVTTKEVATLIRDHVSPGKTIEFRDQRLSADPVRWRADVFRLRSEIPQWAPRSIEQALSDCCDAWQSDQL